MDVVDLFARAELVDDVVDEFEEFEDQIADRDFLALAEVDQFPVEPIARGAPFVFADQRAPIDAEAEILAMQFVEFGGDRN